MDNLLRQVEAIKSQGTFYLPISGNLKQPSACTRDIAATRDCSELLLDHSWTGLDEVAVLDPEDLSCNDMAQVVRTARYSIFSALSVNVPPSAV